MIPISRIRYWLPLGSVLVISAILLIAWAWVVPIFESPDELHHWRNAQYIHSHWALPPYTKDYLEAPQAPLYYILISPFAKRMDPPPILKHPDNERLLGFRFDNFPGIHVGSTCWPHYFATCPTDLHRYWPIRLARLATALFSLVAILFTGLSALEWTRSPVVAALAAAVIGFLPQFDFRGASVNNDAAMACFSAIAVYFFVRMLVRGFEARLAVLCSIALALAFLAKVSAAVLVPIFACCILFTAPNRRVGLQRCIYLLALSGAIVIPWLIRNELVYGELFGESQIAQTVPMMASKRSLADPYFRTDFLQFTFRSFFGYFGWMTLKMPGMIYKIYAALFALAGCGLLFGVTRNRKHLRIALMLGSVCFLSFAFLLYFNLSFPQPQGRLLFQSLSAVAALVAVGLTAIHKFARAISVAAIGLLLSINVYALTRIVYPVYWADPPTVTQVGLDLERVERHREERPVDKSHSYTQSFVAKQDGLTAVEVKLVGGEKRPAINAAQEKVRLYLSEVGSGNSVATLSVTPNLVGQTPTYVRLDFAPLHHSAGKDYVLSISADSKPGQEPIRVELLEAKTYDGGTFCIDGHGTRYDMMFRTFYSAPCWSCSSESNPRGST